MDKKTTIQLLFALLYSAISGTKLKDKEISQYSEEYFPKLLKISDKHDVSHLVILGLKQNGLISKDAIEIEEHLLKAVCRYELLNYEYLQLCDGLDKAEIPFIPLKGAVLRSYYPAPWMRTSCDIDILVHNSDLEKAVLYLINNLNYTERERTSHDVSLFSPTGNIVELHYDLVEEGRANNAINILSSVWDNVYLKENSGFCYQMTDEFFYFYHIAHMAKHFENGGCGIRSVIDLWILDRISDLDRDKRDELLDLGGLLRFANVARKLSRVWIEGEEADELSLQMQDFILQGGVYGTSKNRVVIQQTKKGGQIGYIVSRIFAPYTKLKGYYPILEKHPWLAPFMQVRRWSMLVNPDIAKKAKSEIKVNHNIDKSKADEMNRFLINVGLQ